MYSNDGYDRKMLFKYVAYLAICMFALMATNGGVAVLFPIVGLFFLSTGKMESLFWLLLMLITATVGNAFFFKKNMAFGLASRGTLIVVACFMTLKIFGSKKSKYVGPLASVLVYIVYMALPSAVGYCPIISFLKLTLFTSVFLAFYATAVKITTSSVIDVGKIRCVMLSFAILFILGSVAVRPYPAIGELNAAEILEGKTYVSLFKGMTMHSQSLGPIVAMFSCVVFGDMIFGLKRFDKLYVILLILSPVLIYWTSSRTAAATYLSGMMFELWMFFRNRQIANRWKRRIMNITFMLFIFIVGAVGAMSSVSTEVGRFIFKEHEAGQKERTLESFTSSRQTLVDRSMAGFHRKPVIGNGFQVDEVIAGLKFDKFSQYLTCPIEKGVWVAAVLEEGGAVGFGMFVFIMLAIIVKFSRNKCYISGAMIIVMLISNLGEFTMFSMSYTGGMIWAMIFSATIMDAQRNRSDNLRSHVNKILPYWR